MNKSLLTNGIAAVVVVAAWLAELPVLLSIGLFALSGAFTNWLALHMLFEKVPFFYGSGVIPARFEEFKQAISNLMMEQFFSPQNIERFVGQSVAPVAAVDLTPVIEKTDMSPAFDSLLSVVERSSFGGMLAMLGGSAVLMPLKEPFIARLKQSLVDMAATEEFHQLLQEQLQQTGSSEQIREHIGLIVQQRLDELTPVMVKDMVQQIIRQHLGWLVVWGGVLGGLIGLLAALIQR